MKSLYNRFILKMFGPLVAQAKYEEHPLTKAWVEAEKNKAKAV